MTTTTQAVSATQSTVQTGMAGGKKPISKAKRSEIFWGWIFVAPLCIGFLLFTAFPMVYAIILSLCEFNLIDPMKFVGFENFTRVFADEYFLKSLVNALIYALGVPLGSFLSLILSSVLVNTKRGSLFFRMVYYLPTICGAVAITFIWQRMYQVNYGLLATFLKSLGVENPIDFTSYRYIMFSMMIMGTWSGLGVSVLLFYSSLHNISRSLYEAASIDGANAVEKFVHITLPGISSVMFYVLITGILGAFQQFTNFQVMTNDQLNLYNAMPVWLIYKYTSSAWAYQYGYASALGLVLGVVLIIVSVIQFVVSKYWVKYD